MDLWDVLDELFGDIGIWFVPGSVIVLAIVVELGYHFIHGGWLI